MTIYGKQEIIPAGEKIAIAEGEFVISRKALEREKSKLHCNRCGSRFSLREVLLPSGNLYCPQCVLYGRLTDRDQLVSIHREESDERPAKDQISCQWPGRLTNSQQRLADELVKCWADRQNALLWAVTGSGKTEMLFPLLERALNDGRKIALATPRIDVCRELYPRIAAAFTKAELLLRYGGSEDQWRKFDLLVCTTHQLLHFYQAFDLLIVDESDAFPYEGDPLLEFGTLQSLKPEGIRVCLSATPTERLVRTAEQEGWQILRLPQRYHRRPLVLPELVFLEGWRKLAEKPLPQLRFLLICQQLLKESRVLIFCPDISYMLVLEKMLQVKLSGCKITSVSAKDPLREEKILQMRNNHWDILLCTTVLERGVTFANVSVIVLGAEHDVFTKSVLVQIAGRVDRKGNRQNGRVVFCFQEQTSAIRKGIKEIRQMNRLAQEGCDL